MQIVITAGPAWEPLDGMRRITNASTGTLGLALAKALGAAGHTVTLLLGELASARVEPGPFVLRRFSTNGDCLAQLRTQPAAAVLHAAALCDFRVASVAGSLGEKKLSSRAGPLTLTLEPAEKVLPQLRALFPAALLAGWKYELDGMRADALAKAQAQLRDCASDLCVLNGAAWGSGYGIVQPSGQITELPDTPALARWWVEHLGS